MINWINVEDELPPVGEQVLTYGGWGIMMDEYVAPISNARWFKGDRDEYNDEVTHWARINLPE
jgi:hypothetical protein